MFLCQKKYWQNYILFIILWTLLLIKKNFFTIRLFKYRQYFNFLHAVHIIIFYSFFFLKNWILSIIHWFILVCNSWLWVHSGGSDHIIGFLMYFFCYSVGRYLLGDLSFTIFPHFVVFSVEILTLWMFAKWCVNKGFFPVE